MRAAILFSAAVAAGTLAVGQGPASIRPQEGDRGGADGSELVDVKVRVPKADLGVWDPINVNVNPIPWRVYGPDRGDGVRSAEFRHQALGAAVRVEGVAWGYDVKTDAPKSPVLFEDGVVLVKGVDFNRPNLRGKLVRIDGTLRRERFSGRPGFERQFPEYYFLDAASFEVIDVVKEPKVVRRAPPG